MAQDDREASSSLPRTGEQTEECHTTNCLLLDASATSKACLSANKIGRLRIAIAAGTYRVPAGSIAESLLRDASRPRAPQPATASAVHSRSQPN
ncbi:MAG: flagellar biosynthesis anti-sigma factor FlgM [Janthinobacterium lividum]